MPFYCKKEHKRALNVECPGVLGSLASCLSVDAGGPEKSELRSCLGGAPQCFNAEGSLQGVSPKSEYTLEIREFSS